MNDEGRKEREENKSAQQKMPQEKRPGIARPVIPFPVLGGASALYALFYTFCLYRNASGITYPFFVA